MRGLAHSVGLEFQMARRVDRAAAVLTPALLHWGVGHFAALIREEEGRYLIQDPTFGEELWVSRRAFDDETSGYMLVAAGPLPAGWRRVPDAEGGGFGGRVKRATTTRSARSATTLRAAEAEGARARAAGPQWPSYSFHSMLVSLHVHDTPIGYSPPRGPAVPFQVAYHQREVFLPQAFSFSNFGPKWTSSWLSYIEDDPVTPSQPAKLYVRGRRAGDLTGYSASTGRYSPPLQEPGASSPACRYRRSPTRFGGPTAAWTSTPSLTGTLTFPRGSS